MADDTISRQDTLEAICTWDKFGVDGRGRVVRWYEGLEPYVHLRDVVRVIENMPSAQPERKTGRWIRGGAYPHHIFCSACYATYVPNDEWDIWKTGGTYCWRLPRKFCPNCGAKMDKGVSE